MARGGSKQRGNESTVDLVEEEGRSTTKLQELKDENATQKRFLALSAHDSTS